MPEEDGDISDNRREFQENRPKGFLTQQDREFLHGELEMPSDTEKRNSKIAQRRFRIRERFQGAIYDMLLVDELLGRQEIVKAINRRDSNNPVQENVFWESVEAMGQLAWFLMLYGGNTRQALDRQKKIIEMEERLLAAFEGKYVFPEVEISIEYGDVLDPNEIIEEYEETGEPPIPTGEFTVMLFDLVRAGRLEQDEFEELLPYPIGEILDGDV
ncbi:hypothetical protein HSRCO_1620 [Halanaeroarchaeum sp. HSR-CO]|uniref:hypothetical protein n=1 Tax=Halanaeroarchaeum sp. HSR-CO TaxID=2866382 RepID=UPI00217D8202|nr:hypothetical protein [Halanaeroarchaeum sp. HSR-CO]UWG47899.1 hypothetical protein HSRCO_1620 [Halanaeroarchaeum sp. HSR-CO]